MVAVQDHTYECDQGHWITSPEELVRCPAYNKGSPCKAMLRKSGTKRNNRPRGKLASS
jgi:hypothetical protein